MELPCQSKDRDACMFLVQFVQQIFTLIGIAIHTYASLKYCNMMHVLRCIHILVNIVKPMKLSYVYIVSVAIAV